MENNSLMSALVQTEGSPKKGRVDFSTAMGKMGFTSVFDIVRLPKPAFARKLAVYTDADAGLAYDNAMGYAALIARLYREYKTSSGNVQRLAERSGVRALVPQGPTFPNLFEENWDEFCKVGALAAIDSPVAYLSALRVFIQQLEATSSAPERILLDRRRPDLKDLLITHENTFTPRPMLEIVNAVLGTNLRTYLNTLEADKTKPTQQVLAERRFPFELPYNFYHQQCQLGLSANKPRLGALNYQASLLLPIEQNATNHYGKVQKPVPQAQRLLSGLSPQQQALLVEPSVFSTFYLTRSDLADGWQSAGSTYLCPHTPLGTCFLLPLEQPDVGIADPQADSPISSPAGTNLVPLTFRKAGQTETVEMALNSSAPAKSDKWRLNHLHTAGAATHTSFIKASGVLPEHGEGYTAAFDLITAAGTVDAPVKLVKQLFTLTLDEHYTLASAERTFFKQSFGLEVSDEVQPWQMTDLNDFMQRTGLNAEQVEMLLCQRAYSVRLSANCPSKNQQHAGITVPGITGKTSPFPHASHYGACYVNGIGTDRYDSQTPTTPTSIGRDQFDNSMGLEQELVDDIKHWRLTKTSLNRFDRLQRMIRLQRWTGIAFAKLDTLITCAIRAEGEANLGMELNENTLRALGVYRYLDQHYGIAPQEFAALMHDLTPYASGKDEVPLFDQVFNRLQLFETPLILDQTPLDFASPTPANQKTLLQLCAGLAIPPTEDGLLLIASQTQRYLGTLKRDLPTVSSLYRQARVARLFGYSVGDLLALTGLLGGQRYKTALASGRLSPRTSADVPDILDVLMQLDWAVRWLKDSQQTVVQLQQRLGPNVPLATGNDSEADRQVAALELAPLSDDLLKRLIKLQEDARSNVVTGEQLVALGLPTHDDKTTPSELDWFELLIGAELLDENGLLPGLDRSLSLVDEPVTWLRADVDELLKTLTLSAEVKQSCSEKLAELLLGACNRQTQLLEGLLQQTAKLPPERCIAVIHWGHSSAYSLLVEALEEETSAALIEHFQRLLRHAEIVVQLRLSNSALRVFLVNPTWLGSEQYPASNSEPSLAELYLFERFSQWFHEQSQSEDSLLSYFSLANPAPPKLKNKTLRQMASETASSALARLLEWAEAEVTVLTDVLPDKRARSMAQVDWIRRCQATCQISGLSAKALLQATALDEQSSLVDWKAVGEAAMAANNPDVDFH
ncbi:Tc toxin subunit A [Pseudomonas brassicacearum]|uniref:Tc toxin subunit A n=1 Tax=Pseudomonas brassicacearum TaxID=930166 RepID=UPI001BDE6180|nr:Tc toxin subunit A [Pseudomonas brassicacearum]